MGCNAEPINNTVPAGSYPPNDFGLYDMAGNAAEWVEDCWNGNYNNAPSDGTPWTSGDCGNRVSRGGAWNFGPRFLRAAARDRSLTGYQNLNLGFRVARTLTP